jgi:ATP-dependent Lon protease
MAAKDKNAKSSSESNLDKLPSEVVIIPIVNSPIFPGMIAPIILSEDKYTPELDGYLAKNNYVALNLVKFKDFGESVDNVLQEMDEEDIELEEEEEEYIPSLSTIADLTPKGITPKDIYKVGVLCKVIKKLKLPDGSVNLLVHGTKRYRAIEYTADTPLLLARTEVFNDIHEPDEELDAYTRSVINQVKKLSEINPYFNEEMKLAGGSCCFCSFSGCSGSSGFSGNPHCKKEICQIAGLSETGKRRRRYTKENH